MYVRRHGCAYMDKHMYASAHMSCAILYRCKCIYMTARMRIFIHACLFLLDTSPPWCDLVASAPPERLRAKQPALAAPNAHKHVHLHDCIHVYSCMHAFCFYVSPYHGASLSQPLRKIVCALCLRLPPQRHTRIALGVRCIGGSNRVNLAIITLKCRFSNFIEIHHIFASFHHFVFSHTQLFIAESSKLSSTPI